MDNLKNLKLNPRLGAIGLIIGFVAGLALNSVPLGLVFAVLLGGILGSGMASKR